MRRQTTLAALGVAAFTLALRIPTLSEPRWYYDEAVFTTIAWATSKGMTLYVGVFDLQPPGIFWLYRLLLALGGLEHHFVVQLGVSVFVLATALLTFAIARRVVELWPATLAGLLTGFALSLPLLDGDLLNVELGASPFFLAALLLAFSRRWPAVFASGLLLGVALAFRPSFVVDWVAVLVPLLSTGRRELRVVVLGLGVLVTLAIALWGLWLEGSLAAYFNVVAPTDRLYLVNGNRGTLFPVVVRLAIFGAVAAVGLIRAKTTGGRLMALWLPASIAGATLTPKGYVHFVHETIPPLALGLAMLVGRYRLRWLTAPGAAIALVLCAYAVVVVPPMQVAVMTHRVPLELWDSIGSDPNYYVNWFAYASGAKSYDEYAAWFWDVAPRERELARLRGLAPAGGRLQVIGPQPWLYIESGLLPATPYLNTTDLWVPTAKEETRSRLRGGCADVVVAPTQLIKWQDDLRFAGYVPVGGTPWPTFVAATHRSCD